MLLYTEYETLGLTVVQEKIIEFALSKHFFPFLQSDIRVLPTDPLATRLFWGRPLSFYIEDGYL